MHVKFCGITRIEDAHEAVRLGAWAIGLNHWSGSRRFVESGDAVEISAAVRRQLEVVGVFVNPTLDEVAHAAEDASLSMIQLHGDEGLSFCQEVARRTGCKVIKALGVSSAADVQAAAAFRVDYHLLDARRAGLRGGTGETFDWGLLATRRSEVPLLLAGGLKPENVGEAISVVRPFAVVVAGGVESAPGIKDHGLMAAFAAGAGVVAPQPRVPAQ